MIRSTTLRGEPVNTSVGLIQTDAVGNVTNLDELNVTEDELLAQTVGFERVPTPPAPKATSPKTTAPAKASKPTQEPPTLPQATTEPPIPPVELPPEPPVVPAPAPTPGLPVE